MREEPLTLADTLPGDIVKLEGQPFINYLVDVHYGDGWVRLEWVKGDYRMEHKSRRILQAVSLVDKEVSHGDRE